MAENGTRLHRAIRIILIVLGALLVVVLFFLVRQYVVLRREHLVNAREIFISDFVAKHGPLTAADTGVIRSWMTFEYVNKAFNLPSDFLKGTLGITDPSYPNLTLSHWAGEKKLNAAQFTASLTAAVGSYLNQNH
jgi:hypothetical protein